MPTIQVQTNLAYEFFPAQFMTLFAYFLADLLGKDRNLMKYVFQTDQRMSMGPDNLDGHDGNFFWVEISLFDLFDDPDYCREVMPKIFQYLEMNSNLKEKEIYITFNPLKRWHVGRHGKAVG